MLPGPDAPIVMHPNISDFLAMVAAPPIVRHPQDSLLERLYQA